MSLSTFEKLAQVSIVAQPKYVLSALSIIADDYGYIKNFKTRQIEELCDMGPKTVASALDELCKMDFIKFLDKDFVQLKLPQGGKLL